MKLIVCCVIIIANISNNGKASVDSFLSPNMNILFEDTTVNSDKSCYRPCKFNVKPRRCYYHFKIEPIVRDDGKPALAVNGMTPGPPINVCLNDVIVVEVQNKIPGQDLTIHWHGIEQKGSPYMDGVPMVTQCPINYGATYKYAFKASAPGTFFYHSDSVYHQSDGIYGSLVVNQPQPLEPYSHLYDYDRSKEHNLVIAASFPQLLTGNLELPNQMQPSTLIVNGDEGSWKITVIPNFAYRLRLTNAIAIECPVYVQIDQHEMTVIASDSKPVKLLTASKILLHPGERMDVVVRASQKGGGYWVKVQGTGDCAGLHSNAMFLYSGFNYTTMLQQKKESDFDIELDFNTVSGQTLEALQDVSYNSNVKSVYLGIDRNIVAFNESDNEFRYTSDGLPKKAFYPASMSLRERGVVQINGKNFLYPNAPILLRPRDVRSEICQVGEENKVVDPQCLLVLNALEGETLELALVNEGFGSNDSFTFHMHGLGMQVVATWQSPDRRSISKRQFYRLEKKGKIVRNLHNPILKDTIVVPNKGFTIVRIRLDQGGSWLLECRSCALASLPTAVLINAPISIPKIVVDSMPKCGTYKPADVLLN